MKMKKNSPGQTESILCMADNYTQKRCAFNGTKFENYVHVYTRVNKGLCLDLSARKVLIFNYRIIVELFYNILLDNTKLLYASEGLSFKG